MVAIGVFHLFDVLCNQVRLDAITGDVGKSRLEDRHLSQCWEFVDKKQYAVVWAALECLARLEVLLQLGVPYFFEFLRQSVHRHGEDKSEQWLEALDVAWRHNKIEAHGVFEVLEIVDCEVAFFDTALNERIAVKDERCFCGG